MLFIIGENLEASHEDIAQDTLEGKLVLLPTAVASKQSFLIAYRTYHNIQDKTVVYLAFTESELDERYSPEKGVKQYKDFIAVNQKEIQEVLRALVDLEDIGEEEPIGKQPEDEEE